MHSRSQFLEQPAHRLDDGGPIALTVFVHPFLAIVAVEIAEEPEGLGADPDMVLGHLCAFR